MILGDQLADALDIGNEPHVEHPVGFVDHQNFDTGEQQLAALEMVEQPSRRGDQHVCATVELALLIVEGHAADQEGDVQLVVERILDEILLDLRREFARRLEDQRTGHAGTGATALEERQHRQHKGGGLAGARLGDTDDVTAGNSVRNGFRLDRRRNSIAGRFNGRHYAGAQSEIRKIHVVCGLLDWGFEH